MLQCDDGYGGPVQYNIVVYCKFKYKRWVSGMTGPQNAKVRLWYNLTEIPTPQKLTPECKDGGSYALQRTFFASKHDKHPFLRVEMEKDDDGDDARVEVGIAAFSVTDAFDKCMNLKAHHGQCLEQLAVGTPMRSDNALQIACLRPDEDNQAP